MTKGYMVYYSTVGIGRTYCGRNLPYHRAARLFTELRTKYADSPDFIEAGVHFNGAPHINALQHKVA